MNGVDALRVPEARTAEEMELAPGFEPEISGFAGQCLSQFDHASPGRSSNRETVAQILLVKK